VEVDTDLVRSLEEQLIRDLEAFDGDEEETCSDGEEEDYLPGEWESVSKLNLLTNLIVRSKTLQILSIFHVII